MTDDWSQIKARHYEVEGDDSDGSFASPSVCATCGKPWPCDFRAALQRVEELEEDRDDARDLYMETEERLSREMSRAEAAEAKLARLTAAVESYRGTYLVSKSGTHLGDPAGEILAAAAKGE